MHGPGSLMLPTLTTDRSYLWAHHDLRCLLRYTGCYSRHGIAQSCSWGTSGTPFGSSKGLSSVTDGQQAFRFFQPLKDATLQCSWAAVTDEFLIYCMKHFCVHTGRMAGRISDTDIQTFCRLATQVPSLPTPRFVSLVSDFGSICQREATSDALLAYDM